jgi:hypothetical protein
MADEEFADVWRREGGDNHVCFVLAICSLDEIHGSQRHTRSSHSYFGGYRSVLARYNNNREVLASYIKVVMGWPLVKFIERYPVLHS